MYVRYGCISSDCIILRHSTR